MHKQNGLKNYYYKLRARAAILKNDLNSQFKTNLVKRIGLFLKGFTSEEYHLYNLAENKKEEYMSDFLRSQTRFINEPYSFILNNKIVFQRVLSPYLNIPKYYSLINQGNIFAMSTESIDSMEKILNLGKQFGKIVMKPVEGASGKGVKILTFERTKIYVNQEEIGYRDLKSLLKSLDNYIVTQFIQQGQYGNGLFPDSANTIRMITMLDPETQKPFIPLAIQRIGTKKSAPLDNFLGGRGGISVRIDLDSGTLGAAVQIQEGEIIWRDDHPDTQAPIQGVTIPNWSDIKDTILYTIEKNPFLRYIGWDILVLDDGFAVIEANNHSGIKLLQIHDPLLKNEQVRKFYRYYGII